MSCVIFGAGKIARGFIGDLLYESNIPFVFVEKVDSLVDLINAQKQYSINILGAPEKNIVIKNAKALKFSQLNEIKDAIAHADAVFTAVGGKNLNELVPFLIEGIKEKIKNRDSLNIITCENWKKPADILKAGVLTAFSDTDKEYIEKNIGFTEAVIMRSAIEATPDLLKKDPLVVNVQNFWRLPFDASRIRRDMPKGMICLEPIKDFGGFLERKFYTYNAANGTTSYVGALLGYKYIADAAHDERIIALLDGVYHETATALSKKHHFSYDEQWSFTRTSLHKLQDRDIVDYIERNARDPIRKLGKDDRLVGSARLCLEYGVIPHHLATAIACAIYYENDSDPFALTLKNMRINKGIDAVLTQVCSLEPDGELALLIKDKIKEIKDKGWIKS